jgi:hypothetical protein
MTNGVFLCLAEILPKAQTREAIPGQSEVFGIMRLRSGK